MIAKLIGWIDGKFLDFRYRKSYAKYLASRKKIGEIDHHYRDAMLYYMKEAEIERRKVRELEHSMKFQDKQIRILRKLNKPKDYLDFLKQRRIRALGRKLPAGYKLMVDK
jgi:predicted membrane chloride channel (bestrophin family)